MAARPTSLPLGVMFGIALLMSWTLMTAGVALAMWSDRTESLVRLGTWASLWAFTVLTPTLSALSIHRSVVRLSAAGDGRSLAELARLRAFLLLSASMALLSACALVFER
jgi:hypothetical protein